MEKLMRRLTLWSGLGFLVTGACYGLYPPAFSPNNRDYIFGSLLPAWNAPDSWQLARTAPAAQTICGLV